MGAYGCLWPGECSTDNCDKVPPLIREHGWHRLKLVLPAFGSSCDAISASRELAAVPRTGVANGLLQRWARLPWLSLVGWDSHRGCLVTLGGKRAHLRGCLLQPGGAGRAETARQCSSISFVQSSGQRAPALGVQSRAGRGNGAHASFQIQSTVPHCCS